MKPRSFWSTFFIYFIIILVVTPPILLLVIGGPFVLVGGSLTRLILVLRDWFTESDFLFVCGIPALLLWSLLFALLAAVLNKAARQTFRYENREVFRSSLEAELRRAGYRSAGGESSHGFVFRGRGLSPRLIVQYGPDSAEIIGPHYLVSRLKKLDSSVYTSSEELQSVEQPVHQEQETPPAELPVLTREEVEILSLLARGLSDDAIARNLHVPTSHIFRVKNSLFHKFGVNRDDDLVWEARKSGFLI